MSIALLTASDNASSATQQGDATTSRVIIAAGTFGGGTMTLEYSFDGSTFVATSSTLTANGVIAFEERPGMYWRVTLAGATGGSVTAVAY